MVQPTLRKNMNLLGSEKTELRPLSVGWRWARLGEVCEINPRRRNGLAYPDDRPTSFVPMAAVDERSGSVVRPETRSFAAVQRGYTYFEEGDILFAKITPCMQNGKHAIARNLLDGFGFGTTEFHVLRPSLEVLPEWLHYFVRQPGILQTATEYFTGTVGQRRLPQSYLEGLPLPLPPRGQQKRIVSILHEQMAVIERTRTATEAQLEAAKTLPAAYLREVFNSPEAKQWPIRSVSQVCETIDYGFTASADFSVAEPRFLRITDIQNGGVAWDRVPGCQIAPDEEAAHRLVDGDIVFARTGATTGKSFLVKNPPRAVFASYLIRLKPTQEVVSDYMYAFFQSDSYWKQIRQAARGGAQPNVNATLLGSIVLSVPPIEEQHQLVKRLSEQFSELQSLLKKLEGQLSAIQVLPASLLRSAFSGEL